MFKSSEEIKANLEDYEVDYEFDDVAAIRAAVERNGDLMAVPMWAVRDAYGADRLGRIVRENIAKELASVGLGSLPRTLPTYQEEEVRLYRLGSRVSDLIESVRRPSEQGDQILRDAAANEPAAQVEQIREIICA